MIVNGFNSQEWKGQDSHDISKTYMQFFGINSLHSCNLCHYLLGILDTSFLFHHPQTSQQRLVGKHAGMDGQPSMTERTALEPKSFIIQFRIYPPNLESEFGYITYHITNIKTSSFHITIRCSSFWGSEKR